LEEDPDLSSLSDEPEPGTQIFEKGLVRNTLKQVNSDAIVFEEALDTSKVTTPRWMWGWVRFHGVLTNFPPKMETVSLVSSLEASPNTRRLEFGLGPPASLSPEILDQMSPTDLKRFIIATF
jgi:hypothetical protein